MGKTLKTALLGTIILTATLAVLTGCNTSGCTDNRSSIPLAEFYSSNTGTSITLDSLEIHGIGAKGDSAVLHVGQAVSQVYLPMRAAQSQTAWCIRYGWARTDHPALNDTVTFIYRSEPWFASDECGAMYRYNIEHVAYTTHILDSVAVLDSMITNIDTAQLRFFFATQEEEDQP